VRRLCGRIQPGAGVAARKSKLSITCRRFRRAAHERVFPAPSPGGMRSAERPSSHHKSVDNCPKTVDNRVAVWTNRSFVRQITFGYPPDMGMAFSYLPNLDARLLRISFCAPDPVGFPGTVHTLPCPHTPSYRHGVLNSRHGWVHYRHIPIPHRAYYEY
jgi:hypothetical protein